MDKIYEECEGYLSFNNIYFETNKKNGLISLCKHTIEPCIDDCLRGISINSFVFCD